MERSRRHFSTLSNAELRARRDIEALAGNKFRWPDNDWSGNTGWNWGTITIVVWLHAAAIAYAYL